MSKLVCRMGTAMDIPALRFLYELAFTEDDTAFIDRFFAAIQPKTMACCGVLNGDIVSVLYLLPARATCGDESVSVRYLYAGATHPAHRGKGYYGELLQYAAKMVNMVGETAIYLRPATTDLLSYYNRFGYVSGIALGERGEGYHFEPCSPFCELFAEDVSVQDFDQKGCVILPLSDALPPRWWEQSTTLLIGE